MTCPKCTGFWSVFGCELCGYCPACIGPTLYRADGKTDHECHYKPTFLTHGQMVLKNAEGIRRED